MRIDRNIKKRSGYLIGDNIDHGKDQIISRDIRYDSKLFEESNQHIIDDAIEYARLHKYTNIRIVNVTYVAYVIKSGIIGWKEIKRTTKPFNYKDYE